MSNSILKAGYLRNVSILKAGYLRNVAVEYLQHWLLIPYSYGGSDFSGMDCSGVIIEVLKSVGILPHKFDDTAHGLYLKFKDKIVDRGYAGCLVFWFREGKARHVMMMVDDFHVMGACGGGGDTKTVKDAIRNDAFVKLRPINYRGDVYKICDPFLEVKED